MWSILHRMILGELVKVFLLSLVAITGLLLLAGIVAEATQQGLAPSQVLLIAPLLIPSMLPYTVPATTLFATCIVYGRLAHDNEILAVKAAGISLFSVVWPCLFLGISMSLVTAGLYYKLIPYTQFQLREVVLRDVEEFLYAMLKRDNRIRHSNLPFEIYIKRVQGRKLIDPVFKRKDAKGGYDVVAESSEADLKVDLTNGQMVIRMRYGVVVGEGGSAKFDDQTWQVPLSKDLIARRALRARELDWQQLDERKVELTREAEIVATKILQAEPQLLLRDVPADLPKHVTNMRNNLQWLKYEMRLLAIEKHMRPSLAIGCFCFVLIGCPVGIWFSRSDYLSAFIICFIPILLIYYPLFLFGNNVAKAGTITPWIALWAPNIAVILLAFPLYWRLQKH